MVFLCIANLVERKWIVFHEANRIQSRSSSEYAINICSAPMALQQKNTIGCMRINMGDVQYADSTLMTWMLIIVMKLVVLEDCSVVLAI